MTILGYECLGCGETFLYDDYDSREAAADATWRHIQTHNTVNDAGLVIDDEP